MVLPIFSKVYMRGSEGVQVPRYHMTALHIKNCVIKNTLKRRTYQSFGKERFYTPPAYFCGSIPRYDLFRIVE